MNRRTITTIRIIILSIAICLSVQASAFHKEGYVFAVVPQFTRLTIHRDWAPFIKRLESETGIHIRLRYYKNITEFGKAVMKGEPDIAYMNAYQLISSRKKQGYIPLIRDDTRKLKGIIVVRRDSKINDIQKINGKQIAFPAPNAFGASLFVRATLAKKNIRVLPRVAITHTNVYRHVIKGTVIAGAGVYRTFSREPEAVKARLRIIFETPGIATHPLAVHPRVPVLVRNKIITAILKMAQKKQYQQLLRRIQLPKPVRADYKKDYRPLERLGLGKYRLTTD